MSARLPPPARHLLDYLLHLADRQGIPLYLIGGPIRDLLLDRPSLDLDIAVEADAIAVAHAASDTSRRDAPEARLGAETGAADATALELRVKTHPAFATATITIPGFRLDLITARAETYARPGALPTVKRATIREDLLRRDFTINALALRLNGPDAGEILDPAGALPDLDARLIHALHDRSFQDDATRILRAFRYAARFGFTIEANTLSWMKRDLHYLNTISGARLHHEFSRIFAEETPEKVLRSLDDYGALAAIHPALRFGPPEATALAGLRDLNPHGPRAAYWPVLAWRLTPAEAAGLGRRLALTKAQHAALEAMPSLAALEPALTESASRRDAPEARLGVGVGGTTPRTPLKRSAIAEMLSPYPLPALWAFAAVTESPTVRHRLLDYITKARHERPHLTGDDLLALAVPAGPAVGELLRRLRAAKLDGEVRSREDEERLASSLLADDRKSGTPLPAHPEVSKE